MQDTVIASVLDETTAPHVETHAGGARKLVVQLDEVRRETGRAVPVPVRRIVVAGVVPNPWVRREVDDLAPLAQSTLADLAPALIERLLDHIGGAGTVEAFGKAAIVGVDGEVEHGAALIHTPHLGDRFRTAVDGSSIIAFGERRAEPGAALSIPMWHVTEAATRSHYQSVELRIADAPRADEIVVAIAASTGPRAFARIGDRRTDPDPIAHPAARKDRP